MILSSSVNWSALTSGTINLTSSCILHADELSITVVPIAANLGAHSSEVEPPAENKAMSGLAFIASSILTTLYVFPLKIISFPIDLSEATGINSSIGKLRSSRTLHITVPTKPVTPQTATFILCIFLIYITEQKTSKS